MISVEKLFGNFYNDKEITSTRLAIHGDSVIGHLNVTNEGGINDILAMQLGKALEMLHNELGDVNVALALQKGKTLTNDQVLEQFKKTMSEEQPFIARALGGEKTEAYIQFYPQGATQYTLATKTHMPDLTYQITVATESNRSALGTSLTDLLLAFEPGWKNSRETHIETKETLRDTRNTRSKARVAVEDALLVVVHSIAARYPGDVDKCRKFFDFNLLFAQTKHRHRLYTSPLAAGETREVINRSFTNTATITVRNPDDNAPIAVWLSATAAGQPPASALVLQAGEADELKPSELGPLEHTFLLIKNVSDVNEGAYEVEIVG